MADLEGAVECHREADGRVVVTNTPPIVRMTLECLQGFEPHLMRIHGREITFAGQVTYRVTGWDDLLSCLVLERIGKGVN